MSSDNPEAVGETWEKRRFVTWPRGDLFGQYGPSAREFYKLAIPRPEPLELEEDDDRDPNVMLFDLPEWLIDRIIADHNRALTAGQCICGGAVQGYEGPRIDCPIHGDDKSQRERELEAALRFIAGDFALGPCDIFGNVRLCGIDGCGCSGQAAEEALKGTLWLRPRLAALTAPSSPEVQG